MQQHEVVYQTLQNMGIAYELVEHPPVITAEEADRYIEGKEGARTKTLFLTNKKNTAYYLLIMDEAKRVELKNSANN